MFDEKEEEARALFQHQRACNVMFKGEF